jgi:hypothetical protein
MSKNAKRIRIVIIDPLPGHRDQTSLEHARRYVKRGLAYWVESGRSIRFGRIPTNPMQSAEPAVYRGPWLPCWLTTEAAIMRFQADAQNAA